MNSGTACYASYYSLIDRHICFLNHTRLQYILFSQLFHRGQKFCLQPRGKAVNNKSQKAYLQGIKDLGRVLKETPKECIIKKICILYSLFRAS